MVNLKNVLMAATTVGLLGLGTACSDGMESEQAGRVLAKVGDVEITKADLEEELNQLPSYVKGRVATAEGRREFLDNMLTRRALMLEAQRMGLHDDPQIVRQIADYRERLILQRLMADELPQQGELTEDEMREHYEANLDQYQTEEQVRVRQILLKTDSRSPVEAHRIAGELLTRHRQGEGFQELAREHSEDTTARRGGDVGFLQRGRMSAGLEEVAFAMTEPDQVSDPVQGEDGVYILQFVEHKDAGPLGFDTVREQIRRRLAPQRERRAYEAFVAGLRDQHDIQINEKVLGMVGAPEAEVAGEGFPEPAPRD